MFLTVWCKSIEVCLKSYPFAICHFIGATRVISIYVLVSSFLEFLCLSGKHPSPFPYMEMLYIGPGYSIVLL